MEMTALSDLVGQDEPVEPAMMRFTTKPAKSCRFCLFEGQRSRVCKEATRIALRAGLEDCDSGFVYVAILVDKRQLTIT